MATLSRGLLAAVLLLALPPFSIGTAGADDGPLTFVVGAGAGSVFDSYTRVLASHIGRHLPERPKVAVRNLAGGGGRVAAEYLYREAKPDGRTVGHWAGDLIHKQIFGRTDVKLDTRRFGWVGAVAPLHPVCVLTKASGIADLSAWAGDKRPVKLGGIGRNEAATNMSRVVAAALGLPVKLIPGYNGLENLRLAAGRQEVAGGCWHWQSVKKTWARMLAAGEARVVLQAMAEPHPELPSVPNAVELAKSENARLLLMYGVHDPAKLARAYTLPPGTPDEQVARLREAFAATMADPAFVAGANRLGLEVRPVDGAAIEKTVKGLFELDPKFIVQLRKALFPDGADGEARGQ